MSHRIRLGPIAIFLMVVAIILTTLAILTISTSGADRVMAERFAAVTSVRYELEAEGQQFMKEYDEQLQAGAAAPERTATFENSGYRLEIELSAPGPDGTFDIVKWQLIKDWNADDPYTHIWKGAGE